LCAAEPDTRSAAYISFPQEHWTRIYSTNPLERLNREVKRRTDVIQFFLNAALWLAGAMSLEWPTSGPLMSATPSANPRIRVQRLTDPAALLPWSADRRQRRSAKRRALFHYCDHGGEPTLCNPNKR
jgi:hypothetical protein